MVFPYCGLQTSIEITAAGNYASKVSLSAKH